MTKCFTSLKKISKKLIGCLLIKLKLKCRRFENINNAYPYYMKEVFEHVSKGRIRVRKNYTRVKVPFWKTSMGQKSLSYTGPSVWNKLPSSIKRNISLNTFKHDVRKYHWQELKMWYNYYHYNYYQYVYQCYYYNRYSLLSCYVH